MEKLELKRHAKENTVKTHVLAESLHIIMNRFTDAPRERERKKKYDNIKSSTEMKVSSG